MKIPDSFSVEIDNLILKFIWKCKGLRLAKTTLKKNKVGGLTLFFSNWRRVKTTVIISTTVWYWRKARHRRHNFVTQKWGAKTQEKLKLKKMFQNWKQNYKIQNKDKGK